MFLQIKTYLTAILVSLLLIVGGYAYYAHTEIQHLNLNVATYKLASEDNLKAKEQSNASCLITIEALSEHYRTQAALISSQKATGDAINALPTLTLRESSNAAPTKPQALGTQYADDDRLSPSTMQLLDNAYCDGDKDHCASPTK